MGLCVEAVSGGAFSKVAAGTEGVGDDGDELIDPVWGVSGGGCPVGGIEGVVGGDRDGPPALILVGVADSPELFPVVDPGDSSFDDDVDVGGAGGERGRCRAGQVPMAGSTV